MAKKTSSAFRSGLASLAKGSSGFSKTDKTGTGLNPVRAIQFGKPSSSKALLGNTGSSLDWSDFTKALTGSSGAGGSGGSLLSSLGFGSLFSGLSSLFGGGGETPSTPALKLFELSQPTNETVHVQTNPTAQIASNAAQLVDSRFFANRSNDIAKAVKTAMLNSHSLNDVISEL